MSGTLTSNDHRKLAARWIDSKLAEQAGLFRVNSSDGAALVGRNGAGDYAGIGIPNVLPGQSQPREYRLRRDHPDMDLQPDGSTREKGKYLHPPGRGNLLYFPLGTPGSWLQDANLPVAVVEGELKALALWRLANYETETARWLPIGILGCWNWRGTVGKAIGPEGGRRDVKGVIPDLDRIAWVGRLVYLVPDTNLATNPSVAAAWRELGKELERRGANTVMVGLPTELPGVNGVDDLLVRWGPERVLELFEAARPRSTVKDFHLTDLGNAQRLVNRHGRDLRFVTAWNNWAIWDGKRWKRDDLLEVQNRAKNTVQSIYAEAAKLRGEEERKGLASFAMTSESAQKIRAMLDLTRSEVAARAEDFDQNPDLLNCMNGTLHLPTGELRPHRREDRITKLVHFDYNPQAQCPVFLAFLSEIMGAAQDVERALRLVHFLQTALGYSLTGRTSEKAVFVCHGSGDNGKTTLLSTIRQLVSDYSVCLQIDSLMTQRWHSNNAQADLADLQGARFAMTSETEAGQRLSEGRLKRITQGMGRIRAVRKYENPVTFPETHKLWMDCNHKPRVRDDGRAIWNRLVLIPFEITIAKDQQDKELPARLLAEGEGILGWIAEGARRWHTEGLTKPPEVEAATDQWRQESDILEAFFSDCCIRDNNCTVRKDLLYQRYRDWADKAGERIETKRAFGKKLLERGFDERNDGNSRYWLGLGLLSDTTDT